MSVSNQARLSVGVRTRTEIDRTYSLAGIALTLGGVGRRLNEERFAFLDARAWRHGCDPTNMAGVRRSVQRGNP